MEHERCRHNYSNLGLILLIAVVVAMISRRMRLPYSVGLVAAGVLLAQAPIVSGVLLSPEGIYTILLPPLIFEAALQIRWSPFRRDLPVILTLAFAGVAVAAATVAAGIHFLVGWSWIGALLFGVLIAATDPVSVIAAFKEMPVAARLSLLVEAESCSMMAQPQLVLLCFSQWRAVPTWIPPP
jgi:CPA1 family monovalent cation:H+ antiporter